MKRHLKIADIRENAENSCPFGLPIPFGCQNAGKNIERMAPLEIMGKDISDEEKKMIGNANTKLLAWNLLRSTEKPTRCPYVGHFLGTREMVECNYDDSAPGQGPGQALTAAPFYSKIFSGVLNGLYTYPAGYYSDYNVSRNLYYGIYSLLGNVIRDIIKKIGEFNDE